jgi:hypothetical protein
VAGGCVCVKGRCVLGGLRPERGLMGFAARWPAPSPPPSPRPSPLNVPPRAPAPPPQDPSGEAAASAQKQLVYYELDLGLNHVVSKGVY